ncbi:Hypothetical predicted protein [Mytilus galloprovincialis]|uniref:Reverse transcriptase domain-containing protein n=1 Tax=Mytilus galloprovincialis TaxID=29158 RepID=A0A8B6DJ50_MYTGA|nr:Hypothetical predicted protein [Mytilus galloprovincialis]
MQLKDKFLYITVLFGDLRIAALVDTGSSINVISKSLYDSISDRHKLYFEQLSESEIRLANNDKIRINGISKLQATIHQKNEIIETYIIPKTSHPLILGTEYLRENKIVLDFSDFSCNQKTVPVKTAECLLDNLDLFVTKENPNLGYTHLVEHKIHLKPNAVGKHHKPYRLPPYKREVLREQLDNLLEQGIVVPVSEQEELPITSPIVLVTKRNEASNSKTSTQSYRWAYPPNRSRYTAFNTCFGTYKFLRLPMGLKTAPNTFQLLMDKVLRGLKFRTCLCYLDDVLICSETFEKHLDDIKEIFKRFRDAGLKLGTEKMPFCK